MPQAPSTRWCPTPEQLMILEEMYRNGVRTPNASQIQQITAHLSYYGKIEGKNVFYWFQNHKARDRQKLRRMLSRQHQQLLQTCPQCPLLPQLYTQLLPQFLIHQGGGLPEPRQGMDLLGKMESGAGGSIREEASSSGTSSTTGYGCCEWPAAKVEPIYSELPYSFRPKPKTLELFPTKSTGIKDECSNSMSSSCSASTN